MKEKNNPPFYVGQKVVAVKDFKHTLIKNGQIFTVLAMKHFCCSWNIDVGYKISSAYRYCAKCGQILSYEIAWVSARFFAPLDEPRERIRYVAVSESLREKAQEVVVESVTGN